mmetsp:Transcript_23338/g.53280  ORF Transcript_23338/g.53280 Transcript_23338/m.53280 type:complete len:291 (-) Transcript_23338:68-940(-)
MSERYLNPHAFTAQMCAGSRAIESRRRDSLFDESPTAELFAGARGMAQPMGDWIMVPRMRFADDLIRRYVGAGGGIEQLVLLGAGFDSRAWRNDLGYRDGGDIRVFEIDSAELIDFKETIIAENRPLMTVASRDVIRGSFGSGYDDDASQNWATQLLQNKNFSKEKSTLFLLEGLMMYLDEAVTMQIMKDVKRVSGSGSILFHDAITSDYLRARISVAGAPFLGGNDNYLGLWSTLAGFDDAKRSVVLDFSRAIHVDRARRKLVVDDKFRADPEYCRRKHLVLFVLCFKK